MFTRLRLSLILGTAALLTACAGTPPVPQQSLPVAKPGSSFHDGRSPLLDVTSHVAQHLDGAKNIYYSQNFGGGGLGLGLLGPFGVAANVAMIESNTKADADALRNKIPVDPKAAFADAMKASNTSFAPQVGPESPQATPYLHVVKTDADTIVLAAALIVESGGTPAKWTRRYFYQLDGTYTVKSLAETDAAKAADINRDLREAFRSLLSHLPTETAEAMAKEQPVQFKSNFLNPRFDFEQQGTLIRREAALTWIRGVGGVYALRAPFVSLVGTK